MPSTPEQKAAEEQAEAAVQALIAAYGMQDHGVLTDFVIVAVQQGWDDDGDEVTCVSPLLPRALPMYRLVGILEHALVRIRADIVRDDED